MTDPKDDPHEGGGERGITRREALAGGLAAAGAAVMVGGCERPAAEAAGAGEPRKQSATRMPVIYLPHGGGPWPWVPGMMPRSEFEALERYLRSVAAVPRQQPRALLVISAHWEARVPTVMTSSQPPMLYDYSGFPEDTYSIQWPAPGEPQLAARVRELLGEAQIDSASDERRGFDHGTFVPLKLVYPEAQIPTVQLSLQAGLDPARHLAIGRALAPLRDEGVLIVGSGMSYHNFAGFRDPAARGPAQRFDQWLRTAATSEPAVRDHQLARWTEAPAARQAHPREEHLIPLMVVAGAAGQDVGETAFNGLCFGKEISAFHFG